MVAHGSKQLADAKAELERITAAMVKVNEQRAAREIEDAPATLGAALRQRLASLPELSPEEIERRAESRQRRKRDAKRRNLSGLLLALKRDCGERLDPFKRATLRKFEQYDPEMKPTLLKVSAYVRDIASNVEAGNGIFFIGPPGTGKDHLAVAIAREAVLRLGVSARWLDAATFRSDLRDGIKSSKEERRIVGPYLAAGVLILSDPVAPGSELTNFQADCLYRLIDGRYRACRPTFTTSNLSGETEALELLGSQIVDRLSHGGLRLLCQWESFRRRA